MIRKLSSYPVISIFVNDEAERYDQTIAATEATSKAISPANSIDETAADPYRQS